MTSETQVQASPLPFPLKTLLSLFLLLVVWQFFSLAFIPKSTTEASDLTTTNILDAVSKERTSRNLSGLNTDPRLSSAAQYKANDMMNRHYFSHTDPEGNYIWEKIAEAGYSPYLQLGENLAIEFYNTESLVAAWMNSPTHRANILNEGFIDQGMGLSFGTPNDGQYYSAIANTFGALVPPKKSSPPTPTPTPEVAPAQTTKDETQTQAQTQNTQIATPPKSETATTPLVTVPTKTPPPVEPLRSESQSAESQVTQNFKLPEPSLSTSTHTNSNTADAITARPKPKGLSAYQINRYLMLGFGGVLLVMLISDTKKIFAQKFQAYDKKINNLVLLILSLIVIALIYWL
jgi:uncharacterized protein YkwD